MCIAGKHKINLPSFIKWGWGRRRSFTNTSLFFHISIYHCTCYCNHYILYANNNLMCCFHLIQFVCVCTLGEIFHCSRRIVMINREFSLCSEHNFKVLEIVSLVPVQLNRLTKHRPTNNKAEMSDSLSLWNYTWVFWEHQRYTCIKT